MLNKLFARLLFSSLFVAVPISWATATTFNWNNAAGGLWALPNNWSPVIGGPPSTGDIADFSLAGSYTVSVSTGAGNQADTVTVSGASVTTFQSASTSAPGVLTVTTGGADFGAVTGGNITIGAAGRPVTVNVGDLFQIGSGELTIAADSDVTAAKLIIANSATSVGLMRVTGAGTTMTITGTTAVVAGSGGTGTLIIENGGACILSGPTVMQIASSTPGTRGSVEVLSGGMLTTRAITVGNDAPESAQLLVSGSGSKVTQTGASALSIGNPNNNSIAANLTVEDLATFDSGTGTISVLNTGAIHVRQNGTFNGNGNLTINGGAINVLGGAYNGATRPATISNGGTVWVRSGAFAVANLTINDLTSEVILDGGEVQITGLTLNGGGRLAWRSGALTLRSGTFSTSGASALPSMPPGATLNIGRNGAVTLNGSVSQPLGTTILAEGSSTLGVLTAVDGFASQGRFLVNGKTVTLRDANDAVFDSTSFVKLDDGAGAAGTVSAANGLTLDFGGNVTGFGTVNTPNDPFRPLINNGHITGNSAGEPITLPGYVKGVGTLDNVTISGTSAPGFSPATVYYGNVNYAGSMQIELAGAGAGQFDVIHHSGTATLGGGLDVSLIGGFIPSTGSIFEIITATGGVAGAFTSASFPALAGLMWQLEYQPNAVTLAVAITGDYNRNGVVDAADYVLWRKTAGQIGAGLAADGNGNSEIDAGDYDTWRTHLGHTAGSGSGASANAAVPEPATAVLLIFLAAGCGPIIMSRGR